MSTTVPATVARPRILLAVDIVTRIRPSQSVDSPPTLRCARPPHTTFDRSGHRAPIGSCSFLITLRSASGSQSNSFASMPERSITSQDDSDLDRAQVNTSCVIFEAQNCERRPCTAVGPELVEEPYGAVEQPKPN